MPIEAFSYEVPKKKTDGYSWKEVYSDLVVHNDPRNELIASILATLIDNRKSTLCLVKEIAHGEQIQKLLAARGYAVPFIKGENTDNRIKILEFNLGDEICVIGTTGVIGEGTDTKPAEYIIVAGLGKSKPAFMQQCGRGVRRFKDKESAKVILFKDSSHRWAKAHYAAQKKILEDEYGVAIVKVD